MTRKTKAQLIEERAAFLEAQAKQARESYPTRFMAAMERLHKLGGDVFVKNGMFQVRTLNDETFTLAMDYDDLVEVELCNLEYELDQEEAQAAEAQRKAILRTTALNKLSAEEREVLGV